jgi:hypothetical protein
VVLELARPQATVVSAGAVIVGKAAGLIVILETSVKARPQMSVAVHVSVTVSTSIWCCKKKDLKFR